MSSTILDDFSVWSSVCPSDEEGLSDRSDDSPELEVLELPTGDKESRTPRAAGSSTGGAANSFFGSNTTGRSAGGTAGSSTGGTAGNSVGCTTSSKTDVATANMASKEDPARQESARAATVKKIWTRGWFKNFGKRVPDRAICTLCV